MKYEKNTEGPSHRHPCLLPDRAFALFTACEVEVIWPGEGSETSSGSNGSTGTSTDNSTGTSTDNSTGTSTDNSTGTSTDNSTGTSTDSSTSAEDSTDEDDSDDGEEDTLLASLKALDYVTYEDSSLSCAITEYGGIEFGTVLQSAAVATADDGYYLRLELGTMDAEVYGVSFTAFVTANGTLGIYDTVSEEWVTDGVAYELSDSTLSGVNGATYYVTALYLPLSEISSEIELLVYIETSASMSVQFGGSSRVSATLTLKSANDTLLETVTALDYVTYEEASLSCAITEYGGIEFGTVLQSAAVAETDDGYYLKLELSSTEGTAYGVSFTAFVTANGKLGVYDTVSEEWVTDGVAYELSDSTLSGVNGATYYVTALYVPLSELTDEVELLVYIETSTAMSVQFGGSSKVSATLTLSSGEA